MTDLWTTAVTMAAGLAGVLGALRMRAARRARRAALSVGALVFVSTPDKRRLIARILSCGASHYWIELAPGDARWWVPASAVEPVPKFLAARLERKRVPRAAPPCDHDPSAWTASGVRTLQRRTHIS